MAPIRRNLAGLDICTFCRTIFCERTNTIFYDLRTEEDKVLLALKMLLNVMSLRAIARILEIRLDTVRRWLSRAAEQSEEVKEVLLRDLDISKVELDEL
jgi:transposase-like protein